MESLASLFPKDFIDRLINPLFASPERVAVVIQALGAPLAHACAGIVHEPAIDVTRLHRGAAKASLRGKKIRARSVSLLTELSDAGINGVAMKGLATAYSVYPRPAYRLLLDVDVLFRESDLPHLASFLAQRGYCTAIDPSDLPAWGVLAKASFAPIFPANFAVNLDVHRAIDEWPASRGLDAARVFNRAVEVETEWGGLSVVSREHGLIIAALNAYRDYYRPVALKGLFDMCLMLSRHKDRLDYDEIESAARRGRFVKRIVFYREILAALGAPRPRLFENRHLGGLLKNLLATVVENYRTLAWRPVSNSRKIILEASLLDSPLTAVVMNGRRLYYMAAPQTHFLPGVPVIDFKELK